MSSQAESSAERRADQMGRAEQARIYCALVAASFAYNYNFVLVDFIRPFLVQRVGMSLENTAWLYTAQGAGVIVGSFLTPVLVSRWRSRPVLIGSAFAVGGMTAVNGATAAFPAWVVLRFLVGFALAGTYVSATTMLANLCPPRLRGRLLSAYMAMFSVALLSVGGLGAALGVEGWRTLIGIGSAASLAVALLAAALLPSDQGLIVYDDQNVATEANTERGSWTEMLAAPRLWLTLACLLLAGLNFSAYQFYSGFITTYLMTVRRFSAELASLFVIIDGVGTLLGTLAWGWVADRYGRRVNAVGFVFAAAFVLAFLVAPVRTPLLLLIELGYAICLSCTNVWAAYFAELFPVRLRPMGTSLFHGGHIISLFAPLLIAFITAHSSLALGMALAPLTFLLGAGLWWCLPETLKTSPSYRGFSASAD